MSETESAPARTDDVSDVSDDGRQIPSSVQSLTQMKLSRIPRTASAEELINLGSYVELGESKTKFAIQPHVPGAIFLDWLAPIDTRRMTLQQKEHDVVRQCVHPDQHEQFDQLWLGVDSEGEPTEEFIEAHELTAACTAIIEVASNRPT